MFYHVPQNIMARTSASVLSNKTITTDWTIVRTCNMLIYQFLTAKKLWQIWHGTLGCAMSQLSYVLITHTYIPHICSDVLLNISAQNLKYMLTCGTCINHHWFSHLPNSTHILGGHNIYHHGINMSQHHLQLGGHIICHHGKNIN